jgi:hypothetical protein
VNPATLKVTHLVVREKGGSHAERLVPFDRAADATHDGILLDCTRQALAAMDPFIDCTYLQVSVPDYHCVDLAWVLGPGAMQQTRRVLVEQRHVPPHTLVIDHDTRVEAAGGKVGHLRQLEVEPESGRIIYLVLCEGRLWRKKDVAIPVGQIASLVRRSGRGSSLRGARRACRESKPIAL